MSPTSSSVIERQLQRRVGHAGRPHDLERGRRSRRGRPIGEPSGVSLARWRSAARTPASRTSAARSAATNPGVRDGDVVEAYVVGERHPAGQHAELLAATGRVGQRDRDLVVEQAGRAQRRVDGLGSAGRADHGDAGPQRVSASTCRNTVASGPGCVARRRAPRRRTTRSTAGAGAAAAFGRVAQSGGGVVVRERGDLGRPQHVDRARRPRRRPRGPAPTCRSRTGRSPGRRARSWCPAGPAPRRGGSRGPAAR